MSDFSSDQINENQVMLNEIKWVEDTAYNLCPFCGAELDEIEECLGCGIVNENQ